MAVRLWPRRKREEERQWPSLSLEDWASWMQSPWMWNQFSYPMSFQSSPGKLVEQPTHSFQGYVQGIYQRNGPIFSCMLVRMQHFSEARFQFRQIRGGRPGNLFGSPELEILEHPRPGQTTGDLLARATQDADLAGNFYVCRRGNQLKRLRPDWVTIVLGSESEPSREIVDGDLDATVLGYIYQPGGPASRREPQVLDVDEVAHFAPIPDPMASFRGMSWLSPVIQEVLGDQAATEHKLRFFENGATVNLAVVLDPSIKKEAFDAWVESFEKKHKGVTNAYKTLYLGGGADPKPVGANMEQIQFKVTQGAGETRIAAAAGVPPIIAGFSEGLESATYSNYDQARRRFADGTCRPWWRNFAGSMAKLVEVPASSELWYDDRDVAFLREDVKVAAEAQQIQAVAISTLINAGFEPDTVVDAVMAGDLSRLSHTGLVSVQLQEPGAEQPSANGNGKIPAALSSNGN